MSNYTNACKPAGFEFITWNSLDYITGLATVPFVIYIGNAGRSKFMFSVILN